MYQAIQVKYLATTNHKGTRYKAFCPAGSLTVSCDYALNAEKNAVAVAKALAEKLNWPGRYIGGVINCGDYVFVQTYGPVDEFDFCVAKRDPEPRK